MFKILYLHTFYSFTPHTIRMCGFYDVHPFVYIEIMALLQIYFSTLYYHNIKIILFLKNNVGLLQVFVIFYI